MQLTYTAEPPIGVHGQKIEAYPSAIVTGLASTAIIHPGTVVVYADAVNTLPGKSILAPAATGEVTTVLGVMGIALWDPTYPEPPYRVGASVPVMRKGRVAIVAETALTPQTNPFVRFAASVNGTILGSLRADADTAAAVAAPYLQVIAVVGGVAIVEIDL